MAEQHYSKAVTHGNLRSADRRAHGAPIVEAGEDWPVVDEIFRSVALGLQPRAQVSWARPLDANPPTLLLQITSLVTEDSMVFGFEDADLDALRRALVARHVAFGGREAIEALPDDGERRAEADGIVVVPVPTDGLLEFLQERDPAV